MGLLAEKLGRTFRNTAFILNQDRINLLLLDEARKKKQVVYGAQAMNIQLNPLLRRPTPDVDIYDRNPKKEEKEVMMLKCLNF